MVNKVTLIGRLGKDPDIRSMNDGKEVATFSLATSERWKDKNSGEKKEKTWDCRGSKTIYKKRLSPLYRRIAYNAQMAGQRRPGHLEYRSSPEGV